MQRYNHNSQSFGSRKIRHIHAENNGWVRVHRAQSTTHPASNRGDWLWAAGFKIGGAILAFVIICKIITALMPFLLLGALGWFFLATRR